MIGKHVERDLVAYHDGLLTTAERERVEAHVARCARCRRRSDAIAQSTRLLAAATAATQQMPAARVAAIRASLRDGDTRRDVRAPRARWLLAAAAAALCVTFSAYLLLRPARLNFVAPAASPRSIERSAVALHREWSAGRFRLDYQSESPSDVRRFVATHVDADMSLPLQASSPRARLVGVSAVAIAGDARGAAVAYRIADQPVLLLTSTELRDPPRDGRFAKHVELRHGPPGTRTFTWTASDETYTFVVPAGVAVAEACAVCHQDTERLALIRRHAAGL